MSENFDCGGLSWAAVVGGGGRVEAVGRDGAGGRVEAAGHGDGRRVAVVRGDFGGNKVSIECLCPNCLHTVCHLALLLRVLSFNFYSMYALFAMQSAVIV